MSSNGASESEGRDDVLHFELMGKVKVLRACVVSDESELEK
jgi:hypothetical protein